MAPLSIRAERLGKRYRLGGREPYRMLRDVLAGVLRRHQAAPPEPFWALRDVSFEISEGEVVGVIGRNGAGKSTLLKLLSRITRPTEGRAEIFGHVGSLLEVGTGFQAELTGRENVFLNGSILGMRNAEIARRLDEIVSFAEVERFLDTPVKHYSSGMYMRLAFAVAAHLEPDILIVDEVLAVGDVAFQRKCLGRMRQVAGVGRTVLFVSHSMPAVRQLCTRALLLEAGRLARDGSVDEVVAGYLTMNGRLQGDGQIPEDAPRVVGTGEARLRLVRLTNRAREAIDGVFLGQPFRVEATFEVLAPLEAVAVELGISSADGLRVATSASVDGGQPSYQLAPGRWRFEIDVDATLLPGEYAIDVFMHHMTKGRLTIEWVERCLLFAAREVSESGSDHYENFAASSVRGFVRPKAGWLAPVAEP